MPVVGGDGSSTATPTTAGGGGRSRLGWMLAAVVAVIVSAATVVVATGGDDPATETSVEDGSSDQASGQSSGGGEPSSGGGEGGGSAADEGPPTGSGPDTPVSSPGAGDRPDTPVEVAEAFFTAVEQGDCETIIAHMTAESFSTDGQTPEQAVAECEADEEGLTAIASAEFWTVEPVSEQGDRASVAVTVVTGGEESVRELPLRRVDGVWKMDLDPTAAPPAT
jgi:hypothetical protein